MAKLMNEVTVTIESDGKTNKYTAPQAKISGNAFAWPAGAELYITLHNYEVKPFTIPFQKAPEPEQSAHEKRVAEHAQVISDVLKQAETTRLNIALQREKMEADFAAKERADKIALTFAVHNAIQAGMDMEEVTASMRDDYAGYVSDMADQVYINTDLDTLIN